MILVTGATGLVGSFLTLGLLKNAKTVRALKRPASDLTMIRNVFGRYAENAGDLFSRIEWVDGDILDIFSLEDAMEGVEQVYHCAALVSFLPGDRKSLMRINVEGTANVVNAALEKNIRKLIHVSSIAALGRPEKQNEVIDENLVWKTSKNNSNYAISKYGAEREVWRGVAEGLKAVVVNPSVIVGVAGLSMGSSRLFNVVWEGLKFYPPGQNGFVDVRDVVRAMVLLMDSDIRNESFILNTENVTYKRLFDLIAEGFGKKGPQIGISPLLAGLSWRVEKVLSGIRGRKPLVTRETARTAVQRYEYSSQKIRQALDFEYIPIEETIRHFCKIFMEGR
ncbi:MAG: NAD-dependent epimerase/dehydratase family protein [Bacteroidales bacterium]|nr:NAD-dependent epimerase/dehydratase family protein [Bacteroidales bacterium]